MAPATSHALLEASAFLTFQSMPGSKRVYAKKKQAVAQQRHASWQRRGTGSGLQSGPPGQGQEKRARALGAWGLNSNLKLMDHYPMADDVTQYSMYLNNSLGLGFGFIYSQI
jgi:hypothetical protein